MTNEELQRLLARNGYKVVSSTPLAPRLPHPKPQQADRPEQVRHDAAPTEGPGRVIVCITRHSTGRLDRDNLWGGTKAICDALRYAGYIRDDDPASIFTYIRQRKVATQEAQGTEVLIIPLSP
jgi:Holliday junction resolvase RusA-like endonuclease